MTTNEHLQQQREQQRRRTLLQEALEQETIRALSLTQPWATLVAIGAKRQETRSWTSHYRGVFAIHAAKGFSQEDEATCNRHYFREALGAGGYERDPSRSRNTWGLPLGQIIALAWLGETNPLGPLVLSGDLPDAPEQVFGNYGGGRYVWLLPHVYRLNTAIPARGNPRLWHWRPPDTFRDELRVALGGPPEHERGVDPQHRS